MDINQILQFQDKQGIPMMLSIAIVTVLLTVSAFGYLFIKHNRSNTMHKSNILRTVVGDPADPYSTRNLTRISREEFKHIRLAVQSSQLEAAMLCAMPNDQLVAFLENNRNACAIIGHEVPPIDSLDLDAIRDFLSERWETCTSFLTLMDRWHKRKVKHISPIEFMHLIASIQAGYQEAQICLLAFLEKVKQAFDLGSQIRAELGLPIRHPYERYESDYHAFFSKRLKILSDILVRINLPYLGLEYKNWEEFGNILTQS